MDNKIFSSFEKFQHLADITLQTEDGFAFKSHKILLAQSSNYFESLFCGNFQQCQQTLLPIKGEVLHQILHYIMQNEIVLTQENVSDILLAADYLIMEELITNCKTFLCNDGCTATNCIKVFKAAWCLEMLDVKANCKRFIEINTIDVFSNSKTDILDLSFDVFKEILECDNLNVLDESSVWNILVSWIEKDVTNRIEHFPVLLKYIRLQEVDATANYIDLSPVIASNHFVFGMKQFRLSSMVAQAKSLPFSITGLRAPRVPSKIYFICRQAEDEDAELYITYDEKFDYCYCIDKLPKEFCINCCDICSAGQLIFFSFYNYPTQMKAYDLFTEKWLPIRKIPQKVTSYSVVSVNDNIYALGGRSFTEDEEINFEESDDNKEDDDGRRYLTGEEENMEGGYDGLSVDEVEDFDEVLYEPDRIVDIVQRYNRGTNSWYLLSPMTPVNIINVVASNNKIFVIGESEHFDDQVCQVYDTLIDVWNIIPNPEFYRSNYCAAVMFRGKLYLIGGQDKNYNDIKKVEEYDPIENVWRSLADLPSLFYNPKTIVINDKLIVYDIGRNNFWTEYQLRENINSVFLDCEQNIWRDASISKDLLMELRLCHIVPVDNIKVSNEVSRSHKRRRSVWAKSNLSDFASIS